MKKLDAGQWATVISNLAIFAGLVLLVIELDQSNRISSYTSENARRSLLSEATFKATLNDVPVTLEDAPGLLPYVAYFYYSYGDDGNASVMHWWRSA